MDAPFSPDRDQYRTVLASLAERTQARIPALNGRVEKAVKLCLLGDVELRVDGTAAVASGSDAGCSYDVGHGRCTCQDFPHAPEGLCAHRLAAGFARKARELSPPASPAPGFPEAPASVNVHLTIGGRDVQLTLRDTDEGRLLQRLNTVLAAYPLPTEAPTAGPTCPHHGALRPSSKGKGYYCPTKMADGSYCQTKA